MAAGKLFFACTTAALPPLPKAPGRSHPGFAGENGTTPSKSKGLSRNCWVFRDKGPAEAVFGKEPFGDGAPATHRLIEEELIPEMQTLFPSLKGGERILGGYSLEWNPGNHFVEADRRTARAFLWAIQ